MLNLIFNPVAGRGRARHALPRIRSYLEGAGIDVRVLTTQRPGHASELAAALPDDARVVAVGGDGTAHEVASACVGNGRVLGVVPVGSGDDFAFALGIGRHDLEGALAHIALAGERRVDTATANGALFINAASAGFDADVAERVRAAPSGFRGLGAYLYGVVTGLGHFDPAEVEVLVDGRRVYEGRSLLVSTQLGPRTGGSFLFAPAARSDDGLLDVVVAGDLGRLGTLGLLPRVMVGRHLGHPQVLVTRGRSVRLRWRKPQPAHVDGERLETAATFALDVAPASLRVMAAPPRR